ncbi:MAG: GumC family protein, partial [Candidatus Omnitrophota bacterium]
MEQQNPFLEQEIDLREYFRVLYERRWLIISITVILCTLALMRSFMMKPVYQATTHLLIQREAPRVVNIEEVAPADYTGREYYQTQYKILKSRTLAGRVNKDLGGYKPWSEWSGRKKKKPDNLLNDNDRIRALLSTIEIRPTPNTQLVEISAEDVNPKLAAKIANLWAENYISYTLDIKFDASQYASGWLQIKIQEAKEKVKKAEVELQNYRKKNKIVIDPTDKETSMFHRLLQKKAELEISLSENLEYYKEKHPEIIGIKSEITSVEKKIESEKEKELEAKDKEIQYTVLKRDVDTDQEIYESLLKRIGETEITGELKTTNIRIIDKATVPESPVRPQKRKTLLIAFFIGLIGGGGLAFLFEGLDQS